MRIFGWGFPFNFVIFVAFLFAFNAVLILTCEWLERRRRSR